MLGILGVSLVMTAATGCETEKAGLVVPMAINVNIPATVDAVSSPLHGVIPTGVTSVPSGAM